MSSTPRMRLALKKSYLSMIAGAPGTKMFQHLWFDVGTKSRDIVRGGELSCAAFVSSVLYHFQLTTDVHATVVGTIEDMKRAGWKRIRVPRPGAVLRWAAVQYPDRLAHEHIGFAISATSAISNSTTKRVPHEHRMTYGAKGAPSYRPVKEIWWHPKLGR